MLNYLLTIHFCLFSAIKAGHNILDAQLYVVNVVVNINAHLLQLCDIKVAIQVAIKVTAGAHVIKAN